MPARRLLFLLLSAVVLLALPGSAVARTDVALTDGDGTPSCETPVTQHAVGGVALAIDLACTDADTLTASSAAHGTVAVDGFTVTYTPARDATGVDAFTVTPGAGDEAGEPVAVEVDIAAGAPVCADVTTSTPHDAPVGIDLSCTNPRGEPPVYAIGTPSGGTVAGSGPHLTFTPPAATTGTFTFTYRADDGADATVTVEVTNTAPTCQSPPAQSAMGGVALAIAVSCGDVDPADSAAYDVVDPPAHGVLVRSATGFRYTPASAYRGPDQFTFRATDGVDVSPLVTVQVTVVSGVPVCRPVSTATHQGKPVTVALDCSSPRGSALGLGAAGGTHGTVGTPTSAGKVTFTPDTGYVGLATFTVTASDADTSAPATITVDVTDQAPTCAGPGAQTAMGGVALTLPIGCTDGDADPVALRAATGPSHGALTVSGGQVTYTPDLVYAGADSFAVKGNDGALDSPPVVVTIATAPRLYADAGSVGGTCSDTRALADAVVRTTPVCTVKRALSVAPAGATVELRRGTYTDATIADVHRATPVVIRPATGEKPVLKSVLVKSSDHLTFRGLTTDYVRFDNSSDIRFEDNDVTVNGLWTYTSRNVTFTGNRIHDSNDGLVFADTTDITVAGNTFDHIPTPKRKEGGDGIQATDVDRMQITGNTWSACRSIPHADAIEFAENNDDVAITGNRFTTCRGIVAVPGERLKTSVNQRWLLANNQFLSTFQWAFKLLNVPGIRVLNNTAWKSGTDGMELQGGATKGAVMANNIADTVIIGSPAMVGVEDYNLIVKGYRKGKHDLSKPPVFVNAASNLRLKVTSPGVDAGTADYGAPATDLSGAARFDAPTVANTGAGTPAFTDIGALEFTGP